MCRGSYLFHRIGCTRARKPRPARPRISGGWKQMKKNKGKRERRYRSWGWTRIPEAPGFLQQQQPRHLFSSSPVASLLLLLLLFFSLFYSRKQWMRWASGKEICGFNHVRRRHAKRATLEVSSLFFSDFFVFLFIFQVDSPVDRRLRFVSFTPADANNNTWTFLYEVPTLFQNCFSISYRNNLQQPDAMFFSFP